MSTQIHIVIIEDNQPYRKSLEQMIRFNSDMDCLGSFGSAEAFFKSAEGNENAADILLLDLNLPGRDGLSTIPAIKQLAPEIKILVVTQDNNYLSTLEAIRLGVSGYLLKTSKIEDIERTIREVEDGGCVIDPSLSRMVLDALDSPEISEKEQLPDREREVLELLAMGYPKKEVADQLNLSYRTVAVYTERIYKRLGVPNIAAAVATAIRKGLI